jgi:LPXTG-motif cell wall-anchored protein
MKGLTKMKKRSAGFAVIGAAIAVTLGAAAPALAVETYYSNEDGANLYVESCAGADFTVTIDGTEYGPGDVATGFSLNSDYSVSAGAGVTVNFVQGAVVQGGYGHGFARDPLALGALTILDVPETGDWRALFGNGSGGESYLPGIFFAECSGDARFAYIQTFPGLTLDQAGLAATLDQGVYVSDQAQLDSLAIDPDTQMLPGLLFAPMSDFRNAGYAFWANYMELQANGNTSASVSFDAPLGLPGDAVEAVWGYAGWLYSFTDVEEFASSYYTYSSGSGLTESGVDDGFEEDGAPSALAATGANVEWLMFAGLMAVVAGSGFLVARRRTRI